MDLNTEYKVTTSVSTTGASSLLNQEADIFLEVEWFAGRLVPLERLPRSVKQNLRSSTFDVPNFQVKFYCVTFSKFHLTSSTESGE